MGVIFKTQRAFRTVVVRHVVLVPLRPTASEQTTHASMGLAVCYMLLTPSSILLSIWMQCSRPAHHFYRASVSVLSTEQSVCFELVGLVGGIR